VLRPSLTGWPVSEASSMTREEQRRSGKMVGDKRNVQRSARAKRGSYLSVLRYFLKRSKRGLRHPFEYYET